MSPVAIAVLVVGFALIALLSFIPRRQPEGGGASLLGSGGGAARGDAWMPKQMIGPHAELPDAPETLALEIVEDASAGQDPEARRVVARVDGQAFVLELWDYEARAPGDYEAHMTLSDGTVRLLKVAFAAAPGSDEARAAHALVSWLDVPAPPSPPSHGLDGVSLDGLPTRYMGRAFDHPRGEAHVLRLGAGCFEDSPVWLLLGEQAGQRWAELRHGLGPERARDAAFALDALLRVGAIPDDRWRQTVGAPIITSEAHHMEPPDKAPETLCAAGGAVWGVLMDYDKMRAELVRWATLDSPCERLERVKGYVADMRALDGGQLILTLEQRDGYTMLVTRDPVTLGEREVLYTSDAGMEPDGDALVVSTDERWVSWVVSPEDDDAGDDVEDHPCTLMVFDRERGEAMRWAADAMIERLHLDGETLWFIVASEDRGTVTPMRWSLYHRAPERAERLRWASGRDVLVWRDAYALSLEPRDGGASVQVELGDRDLLGATSALSGSDAPVCWLTPSLLMLSDADAIVLDTRAGTLHELFEDSTNPWAMTVSDGVLVWATLDDEVCWAALPVADDSAPLPTGSAW